MDLKYDLKCPHCKKNIDLTDYFKDQISNTKAELENQLQLELESKKVEFIKNLENEKLSHQEEVNKLKQKVLQEQQNSKLLRSQVENEIREEFLNEQDDIQKRIEESIKNKYELKLKQLQIKESEYKKEIQHLHDKVDGEENRIKGESQELVIEEWLGSEFPLDDIVEIKKGQNGADTLLEINDSRQNIIGSILIESKRTKNFSNSWIKKLKEDLKSVKGNVGVIVTQTMPNGKDYLHELDGIWICHYSEYKNVIKVLRKSLLAIHSVVHTQEQSSDTKSLVFQYLTSVEFKQVIETILEGFSSLKGSINKEKLAMNKIWKEREASIDKVIENTAGMYGKLKGIAGPSIEEIDILKLTKE